MLDLNWSDVVSTLQSLQNYLIAIGVILALGVIATAACLKWETLLDNLTISEMNNMIALGGYQTAPAASVGKVATTDCDGPAALNNNFTNVGSVGFPAGVMIACTWNEDLARSFGEGIADMAEEMNVSGWYAPAMNIHRTPFGGRNFEYYSEDGLLSGRIASQAASAASARGVYPYIKHFALNDQETGRWEMLCTWTNEQAMRELYFKPFDICIKDNLAQDGASASHPMAVMSSYNYIGTQWAGACSNLLNNVLRDEWGFDGFVVSDWGGSNEHIEGVRAGSHLEMPTTGGDSDLELVQAVRDGKISEEIINRRVDEILDVILPVTAAIAPLEGKPFDVDAHHKMAERAAGESIVLLKNEENILPLKKGTRVAVIGEFAQKARYQGAGSSVVNATKLDNAWNIISNYQLDVVRFEAGYPRSGKGSPAMQAKAVELAKQADIVLLYIGLDEISESEGLDRPHMKLPQSQIDLLEAVAAVNPNVVAILSAGSAVEMPWLDKCKAVIHGYLCGQAGAGAILKALTGEINPSGKLAESYPVKYEDVSSASYFPSKQRTAEYREGLYVGYRYYETANVPVLFPFGFGLSYTTFEYSDLKVNDKEAAFTLKNTGSMDGAEVAQLYVSKLSSEVFLKAGESKTVTIPLDDKAFRYFNVKTNQFEVEGGEYQVMIGSSAADIKLTGTVSVQGTDAPNPYDKKILAAYYTGSIKAIPEHEFAALLGRSIPDGSWSGTLTMNDALCQMYYAKSWLARRVYHLLTRLLNKSMEKGKPNLNLMFNYNMPFRGIAKMTGGMCTMEMAEGILIDEPVHLRVESHHRCAHLQRGCAQHGQQHRHHGSHRRRGYDHHLRRRQQNICSRLREEIRRFQISGFPIKKTLDDFDFSFQPSIDKRQIDELATMRFLENGENVVFLGPPGVGKTHLASALGLVAAQHRFSTYYINCHQLIEQLKKAHFENRLPDKLKIPAKYRMLIIDEIGCLPMDIQGTNLFFQLIARRYEKTSTVFTSHKTFSQWNEVFADVTIASAILDRVLHHCTVINIKGESYHLKERKEFMRQKQQIVNTLFEQGSI